jgi:hypothetical protein
MDVSDQVEIISELSREDAVEPVNVVLDNNRQSQLHFSNRAYQVVENCSKYAVLEYCNGFDVLHEVDLEEEKIIEKEKFEERKDAYKALETYSNFSE